MISACRGWLRRDHKEEVARDGGRKDSNLHAHDGLLLWCFSHYGGWVIDGSRTEGRCDEEGKER